MVPSNIFSECDDTAYSPASFTRANGDKRRSLEMVLNDKVISILRTVMRYEDLKNFMVFLWIPSQIIHSWVGVESYLLCSHNTTQLNEEAIYPSNNNVLN